MEMATARALFHTRCASDTDRISLSEKIVSWTVTEKSAGANLTRRYFVDQASCKLQAESKGSGSSPQTLASGIKRLQGWAINFLLPAGFPDSVTPDYYEYMLWQFPTTITAWICNTIITSNLLKAVGITAGVESTAAATAAIKWVSRDGLGAVGRLCIGGRFGGIFDEDPKQWRIYSEFLASAGSLLELATPLAPDQFLLMASVGNLAKAIAKGLADPSCRVVQNHFSVMDNIGDVTAKEEVWGVAGQLVGISLGIYILSVPEISMLYPRLAFTWVLFRGLHLWLRCQCLSVLCFESINSKRASILIHSHIAGIPIPDFKACNTNEDFLQPAILVRPHIVVGCSFENIFGTQPVSSELKEILELYEAEAYVLVLWPNSFHSLEARILLKEGATNATLIRGLYHAHCLLEDPLNGRVYELASTVMQGTNKFSSGFIQPQMYYLSKSLTKMRRRITSFLCESKEVGWEIEKMTFKITADTLIYKFNGDG